jgi:hypothetical protein
MARFGREFVQAATQPSYLGGLLTAAQGIGAAPANIRAEKKKEAEKGKLAGFDPNTVEGLAGLATFYQGRGELDKAVEYATAARTLRDQIEQKQKTTTKEREQEEARARLRGVAYRKAAQSDNPEIAVGRIRDMTLEQLMDYTTPEEPQDLIQLSSGARLIDPDTRKVVIEPTYAPEKPTPPKVEVRLQGDDLVTLTNGKETSRITPPEDSEKVKGARLTVANSAAQQIGFIEEAKDFLKENLGTGGFYGGMASFVPGTDAYTVENKYYQQIRGAEARRAIEEMKKASEEYGSKGTGLGQITQIEFRTLMANISGLTTGLSDEEQIDSLDKMIANYERIQKLASGENIIDVINFPPADADPKLLTREQQQYLKAGYVKEGDTLYYYPQGPDGPERVYNRETNEFK